MLIGELNSMSSNSSRQECARIEIEKKLAVLREYVIRGIPSDAFVPLSVAQFRKWVDDANDLRCIGSPNTLNSRSSPHNQDKIDEMFDLLAKIKRLRKKPAKRRPQTAEKLERLAYERDEANRLNASLASRVHELRAELAFQIQFAEQQRRDVNILTEELTKLRKKFSDVTNPLNPISRVK